MADRLRIVVVTPERTLLDEACDALRFPLYDGQIGILPGRAPMVGRLGYGELKIDQGNTSQSYFIDGGFVQVKSSVVSLLTNACVPANEVNVAKAETDLQAAMNLPGTTDAEYAVKARAQERARKMIDVAKSR